MNGVHFIIHKSIWERYQCYSKLARVTYGGITLTATNMTYFFLEIICPKTHTELMNGNATCSDGARFESECVYVCNPGYEMIFEEKIHDDDKAVLKCQSNGEWGGKLPSCNRKQCSIHDGAIAKVRILSILVYYI